MTSLIERLMPQFSARRAEARLRLERANTALVAEQKRAELVQAYDAARTGGRASGWGRPLTSATTELQTAIPLLRAAARDLVRNSAYGARATRALASHISGTGVRPRAIVPDNRNNDRETIQRQTRDQWERFVERCDPSGQMDFYGQQQLLVRASVEGGEALRLWRPIVENNRLFWRCEILEGDLLDHSMNTVLKSGNRVVQGVEFDSLGRRVAYHLFETHPGERFASYGTNWNRRRIEAQYIDHVYEVLRPGQVRGVSWFAPVATLLRDVDDLAEAELVRKKLEACIAMVVYNSVDESDPAASIAGGSVGGEAGDDTPALKTASGSPVERMTPGMILEAKPGWEVSNHAPAASEGLVEHMRERLHAVAAGLGLPYAGMTGDLSSVNYSSMRGGEMDFNRLVETWQSVLMIHQSGRPAWKRVMQAAQANGDLLQGPIPRAASTPPKRPWVDPLKDASAAILQMRAGLISPQEVISRLGRIPEEVLKEFEEWQTLTSDLPLDPGFGGVPPTPKSED
jgi:lambda family phage portal protein